MCKEAYCGCFGEKAQVRQKTNKQDFHCGIFWNAVRPHARPEKEAKIGSQWYKEKGFRHDGNRKNLLSTYITHSHPDWHANKSLGTHEHFHSTARYFPSNTQEDQMLGLAWHPQCNRHLQGWVEGGQIETVQHWEATRHSATQTGRRDNVQVRNVKHIRVSWHKALQEKRKTMTFL